MSHTASRATLIRLAASLPVGSPQRRSILAGLTTANVSQAWAEAYLKWFEGVEALVGDDMDGEGLLGELHSAISGNADDPTAARREIKATLADFQRNLLTLLGQWEQEEKKLKK